MLRTVTAMGFSILFLMMFISIECMADGKSAFVDFEHLGEPLNIEKPGSKEISILKKFGYTDIENGIPSSGSNFSIARVVGIAGASGSFVLIQDCNSAADGSEDSCELSIIGSLDTGKKITLPNNELSFITSIVSSDVRSTTRYMKNEKGELQSLIYVRNDVRTFKGKRACANKGAILDFDGKNLKLVLRVKGRPLGTECYVPTKINYGEVDIELESFYKKLITKTLAK
ncbi:MAG: hypothetical protein ACKVN9_03145 [Methylophilaceae bacterium]